MPQAKSGDTVRIHYTGRLDDGTVFKTSCGCKPLTFKIGKSSLIPAFQEAVIGMKPGTSRTVKIVASEAYGPRHEALVVAVHRDKFPENVKPSVGLQLDICQQNGKVSLVKVVDITGCCVTLDANHPLAGKDVTFDIELVEII